MTFWWVNHRESHKEEIDGGYLWAISDDKRATFYNLTIARPGDFIFSYTNRQIGAIGIVEMPYKELPCPYAFRMSGEKWKKDGWLVRVDWCLLENPIEIPIIWDTIRLLMPQQHSPLDKNGKGTQKCYLTKIDADLAQKLLQFAATKNPAIQDILSNTCQIIQETEEHERLMAAKIPTTEKEQLIKARRGQGAFRFHVEKIESACRLSHTTDKRFFIASHIKPWRCSDNAEKLDGHNGLLLSPHVDCLFDKGWISFSDQGKVLCANEYVKILMNQWGLDPECNVGPFSEKQRNYLAFHRENIYKSNY